MKVLLRETIIVDAASEAGIAKVGVPGALLLLVVIAIAVLLAANPLPAEASHLCGNTGSPAGPFNLQTYEELDWKKTYGRTMELAGLNKLIREASGFKLQKLESGPRSSGSGALVDPYIPPTILKAIAWIESSWIQADYSVPYGDVGPALVSHDCGYGLMQVTTGMQNISGVPNMDQASIGGHYAFNIARGARILASKWNAAPSFRPIVGNRDPRIVEDWYYAVWSYNGFTFKNHPLNYSSSRPAYLCNGTQPRSNYPYQELVFGCVANPPIRDGVRLWASLPVTLPSPSSSALRLDAWNACSGSFNCVGMDMPTPSPSHTDPTNTSLTRNQVIGAPTLSASPGNVTLFAFPNTPSASASITISNIGTGPLVWRLSPSASWLKLSRIQGVSLGTDIGPRASSVTLRADGLPPGVYVGQVVIESLYAVGVPKAISVTLQVSGDIPVPGDYNGDGEMDLAVWRQSSGTWYVRDVAEVQWGVPDDIPVAGDYDGDGKTDPAVWRPSNGTWYVKDIATVQWGVLGDILVPGDYNGDGRTDPAVWRPSNGTWYVKDISTVQWGVLGDIPVPGDYNGDGKTDLAVWRPSNGTWNVKGISPVQWGLVGDIPVPGDYNGDGKSDPAVWRPSDATWYVRGIAKVQWGVSVARHVSGDYDGDGKTDLAVWRASNGTWYVRGIAKVQWGAPDDIPVPGDYNSDGKTDLAVWRPSNGTWYVRGVAKVQWGVAGDIPVPGDYNGDGKTDLAVWRPSNGTWYVRGIATVQWGLPDDIPVTGS